MKRTAKKVIAFGELLWDLLPSGKVLGGAPANFAFRLENLGVPTFLISRVGNDELAKEALALLQEHSLSCEGIQIDLNHPTGTVDVKLSNTGVPDFSINKEVAYDYLEINESLLDEAVKSSCFCYGTLIQRTSTARNTLYVLLEAAEKALRFLDINLRKNCWTKETLDSSLQFADILKLNDEEARILAEQYHFKVENLRNFSYEMIERFALQACLVTRGSQGVYALSCDGEEADIPGIKVDVLDTIGSGDSFSAGFVKRYLEGSPLEVCCEYGNQIGALVAATKGGMATIQAPI